MCDETLETFVVVTGEIINAESTEAGTYCTETVFIDIRQIGCCIVYGTEIILHALACPIAAYLFIPFRTESWQSATVRGNDYISVCSHYLEVPSVAPELAYRTLRSAFTIE